MAPTIKYLPEYSTIQGNTLVGASSPSRTLKNPALIECLIRYESGGLETAYNPKDTDGRPKYGILQFDSRTFADFCVKRYHLWDNIWDADTQIVCTDMCIRDGYLRMWGTAKLCKNYY